MASTPRIRGDDPAHVQDPEQPLAESLDLARALEGLRDGEVALQSGLSERRRAEALLRESEQRFKIMADSAPVLIWVADTDKRCIWFNQPWHEFTGRTIDEEFGDGWAEGVHADDLERCFATFVEHFDRREPFHMEYRLRRHDGEYRWIHDNGVPRFENGEFRGYIGSCIDITARKEAEEALAREHARNRAILSAASDGIHILDPSGHVIHANQKFCDMLGYTLEEIVGKHVSEWDARWTGTALSRRISEILARGDIFETRHRRRDGTSFDVEVNAVGIDYDGQAALYASSRDITARKRAEESLRLAASVYQASSEAMLISDVANRIVDVNPAFTRITGYSREEVVGRNPQMLSSGHHDEGFYQSLWHSLCETDHWQGEIWNRRKNGDVYPEWLDINVVRNEAGEIYRYIALFSDITEKKQTYEMIWRNANFDMLTGLPNRRLFRDRLEQEIKRAARHGSTVALLFLDLDRFKEVNDTLGHNRGDVLLTEAALRIGNCVRESDTVARLGGDEFTIILPELADRRHVEKIAQHVIEALGAPFQLEDEMVYISASIGITLYPDDAHDADHLVRNADQAMYAAKHCGRNRFSYFTPTMQLAAQARLHLINDLRSALTNGEFEVRFQPIVEIATGAVHKAEALLRWHHPERGTVSPADFVPLAEETGLIHEIGDWVFRESAAFARYWTERSGRPFQVSVNASPVQFMARSSCGRAWPAHLGDIGLDGGCVAVEITEGLLLDAAPSVEKQLLQLRDANIEISIDDFGTGYSALSYLQKFSIDFLKIDQSFVRNLSTDASSVALTEAIIVMAHKLGLKVIAEGVERPNQLEILRGMACDYAQGFLFSQPVPAAQFSLTEHAAAG
ncbi:MAG: EAL domain-containing protein [Gammaproteobacteria bacterium]|nr:EAL domain-containing protein [Gammaproteobacteria bacterium]